MSSPATTSRPEKPSNERTRSASRLVRSMSKRTKSDTDKSKTDSGTLVDRDSTAPPSEYGTARSEISNTTATTSTSSRLKGSKPKLTAIESFRKTLHKNKEKEKQPAFPPSSWQDDARTVDSKAATDPIPPSQPEEPPASPSAPAEPVGPTPIPEAEFTSDGTTLAERIRGLMNTFQSFSGTPRPPSPGLTSVLSEPADGPPAPPPGASPADAQLAEMLSSPDVMNGAGAGKNKQSIWALLDRLPGPSRSKPSTPQTEAGESDVKDKGKGKGPANGSAYADHDDSDDDDASTVMFYAPLSPEAGSELELAPIETVEVDRRGRILSVIDVEELKLPEAGASPSQEPAPEQQGDKVDKGKTKFWDGWLSSGKTGEVHEVRMWVPSVDKISLEARWWGFRIYLPPPVLEVLSNKQLEATKRAAMITTSLQWLVNKIPVNMIPIQFRAGAIILKRLVPYMGYLGGFIAWSWSSVKSFDKGHGVILSATWLMPIALIPGTWEEYEVPELPKPAMSEPPPPPVSAPQTPSVSDPAPVPIPPSDMKTPPAVPSSPGLPGSLFRRLTKK